MAVAKFVLVKWIEDPPKWNVVPTTCIRSEEQLLYVDSVDECIGKVVQVMYDEDEDPAPAELVMFGTEARLNCELGKIIEAAEEAATPKPMGRGHREKRQRTYSSDDTELTQPTKKQEVKKSKATKAHGSTCRGQAVLSKVYRSLDLEKEGIQQVAGSQDAVENLQSADADHVKATDPKAKRNFNFVRSRKPQDNICPDQAQEVSKLRAELKESRAALAKVQSKNKDLQMQLLALNELPKVVARLTATVEALQRAPIPLYTSTPVSPVAKEKPSHQTVPPHQTLPASPAHFHRVGTNQAALMSSPRATSQVKPAAAPAVMNSPQATPRAQSPVSARSTSSPGPKVYTQALTESAGASGSSEGRIAIGPNTTVTRRAYSYIKWGNEKKAIKELALAVFGSVTLGTHSITGTRSNAHKDKEAKPQLDPIKVQDIVDHVREKTSLDAATIRATISHKCNDEMKKLKKKDAAMDAAM